LVHVGGRLLTLVDVAAGAGGVARPAFVAVEALLMVGGFEGGDFEVFPDEFLFVAGGAGGDGFVGR